MPPARGRRQHGRSPAPGGPAAFPSLCRAPARPACRRQRHRLYRGGDAGPGADQYRQCPATVPRQDLWRGRGRGPAGHQPHHALLPHQEVRPPQTGRLIRAGRHAAPGSPAAPALTDQPVLPCPLQHRRMAAHLRTVLTVPEPRALYPSPFQRFFVKITPRA